MKETSFKEKIFAILIGVLIAYFGGVVAKQIFRYSLPLFWHFWLIPSLSGIIGGIIAGWLVRKNGWKIGLLIGLSLFLISAWYSTRALLGFLSLYPGEHPQTVALRSFGIRESMKEILKYFCLYLVASTFGGFLGEKLYWRLHK